MDTSHFDSIFEEIIDGRRKLTPEEREFLVSDTPTFEESLSDERDLREMDDSTLMKEYYQTWVEYCR